MEWIYDRIESVGRELYLRALKDIPPDVREAIAKRLAAETREGNKTAERMQIEEIEGVWWEDLMPECLWKFRVRGFGPWIVAIDSHGNSLYRRVQERAARRILP